VLCACTQDVARSSKTIVPVNPSGSGDPLEPRNGCTTNPLSGICATAKSPPSENTIGKNKPTISAVSRSRRKRLPHLQSCRRHRPTVEQKPPQPPAVAWDGKRLTIDADNSTLAAVLGAVRDRTGASIEVPEAASGERVFDLSERGRHATSFPLGCTERRLITSSRPRTMIRTPSKRGVDAPSYR
jgi:hypothetical protein